MLRGVHIETDRRYPFDGDVGAVWAAMAGVGSYEQWWPWLTEFDANALAVNEVWKCSVRAPLGYKVAFSLKFDVVVPEHHIEASVRGDIIGGAWIDLLERGEATDVWIRSMLIPVAPFLKRLSSAAPPVARFGHNWILRTGARQFNAKALARAADAPQAS